jgi:hypothetical protein
MYRFMNKVITELLVYSLISCSLGVHWSGIEKQNGVYSWDKLDTAINVVLNHGITPFITIVGGNELYSRLGTYTDKKLAAIYGYNPEPPVKDEKAFTAFVAYVKATVERYKDEIDSWEIWNEPNHRNYWGAIPNVKEYGMLLEKTTSLIPELDPGCKIICSRYARKCIPGRYEHKRQSLQYWQCSFSRLALNYCKAVNNRN